MSLGGNVHLLQGISELFCSHKGSDCDIILCREKDVTDHRTKRRRLSMDTVAEGTTSEVFDTLPAHRVILRVASECFAAWLERWLDGAAVGPCELRVPLGSADEASAAKAAIQFAYTGQVAADSSIREILALRQQGAYLQINGCAEACNSALQAKLKTADTPPSFQLVLDLYESADLWPEPAELPSLASVFDVAAAALARHFGDAPKTLNTESLHKQLLALPATALEALLGSDDFGTDSESSVLQLLAAWMDKKYSSTDSETRRRLCRTVRLVHLSRPYLSMILPALAADHEKDPDSPAGWFSGTDVLQAAFLLNYTVATEADRNQVLNEAGDMPQLTAVLAAKPRRQCSYTSRGHSFGWHIPQQQLRKAMEGLKKGAVVTQDSTWDENNAKWLNVGGFKLAILVEVGQKAAGVFTACRLPDALQSLHSRLSRQDGLLSVVLLNGTLSVRSKTQGVARDISKRYVNSALRVNGPGKGWATLMPLTAPLAAVDTTGASSDPLAPLVNYLLDGQMSGTLLLTLPR